VIFGATVTVDDPTRPAITDIEQSGLRTAGAVGGDEPVGFDATDNSGIKRAELVDVTDLASPKVVGERTYACDYSYAAPCPQAANAQVEPSVALAAGAHQLKLRLSDAGGNVTESAPFVADRDELPAAARGRDRGRRDVQRARGQGGGAGDSLRVPVAAPVGAT
jgi:hypothetical protein